MRLRSPRVARSSWNVCGFRNRRARRGDRFWSFDDLDAEAGVVPVVIAEGRLKYVLVLEADELPADVVAIAAVFRQRKHANMPSSASAAARARRTACARPASGTRSAVRV